MKIALISCSKNKKEHVCTAEEMYSKSDLFNKASHYVKNSDFDMWFILSAKYGLLRPEAIIEPYDLTLNDMKKDQLITWSKRVFNYIIQYPVTDVTFFTGENYRKYLIPFLEFDNIACHTPLKGMGIGHQLQFFKNALK
jgi:cytoplasmic iron level regulating protein YaaA (DUF328/UPF0246 family)